ncbi:NUDIX hydrolase [Galactobacter sp.]|uniref:NUDIX domain-containing protein n=1 Tax=Galactobacter sp. TaxID=2676125 RepID=UPI0025BD9073|nr:NUDIX hydrolase [Galactobacter sp.]
MTEHPSRKNAVDPAALPGFLSGDQVSGRQEASSAMPDGAASGALPGPLGGLVDAAAKAAKAVADRALGASVADVPVEGEPDSSEVQYHGRIWDVVSETFTMPGQDEPLTRDFIEHTGAVAMLVLDDQGRILLQRQRRQPVRAQLWEIPAGLLDVDGESGLAGAKRELFEEADLEAARWDTLVDFYTTPGSSSEAIRIYLARELSEVPEGQRFTRGEEEADMPRVWLPVADAVAAVLSGRIGNPSTVVGILALAAHQSTDFQQLRPADAEWAARPEAGGRL